MDLRTRDLLDAEAKFLSDYCGEDAVRRWRARLPAAGRNQLILASDLVQEIGRAVASTLRKKFQTVVNALSELPRPLIRTLEALYALVTGHWSGSLGFRAR